MPEFIRLSRPSVCEALPRMTPALSQYRKRTSCTSVCRSLLKTSAWATAASQRGPVPGEAIVPARRADPVHSGTRAELFWKACRLAATYTLPKFRVRRLTLDDERSTRRTSNWLGDSDERGHRAGQLRPRRRPGLRVVDHLPRRAGRPERAGVSRLQHPRYRRDDLL